jgi:hypothetical protein
MAHDPEATQASLLLTCDAVTFKELLRDLLFREAGKPYFKSFHIPRRRWRRILGDWMVFPTYQAERALLPVGARNTDERIRTFFTAHASLRAVFHEGGMPVAAVHVLRQRCPALNAALEHVHMLECWRDGTEQYVVQLTGGAAPLPDPRGEAAEEAE